MITPANFAAFVTNANNMMGHVYDADDLSSYYKMVSTEVTCTSQQWTSAWFGRMPKMRLWDGPRQPHQPGAQTYTIIPQPWENTYSFDRFDLDDDQYGVYYRLLSELMLQSKRHPDYQFRDLLEASGVQGSTAIQKGPDGVAFFSTSHPVNFYNSGAGTYINDFSSGGQTVNSITVGGALSTVGFATLYEYMTTLLDDQGERLGIRPTHLMHPPTLKVETEIILRNASFAPPSWSTWGSVAAQVGAADNPLKRFGVEPLENIYLSSFTKWYLLDNSKPMKPLTKVNRTPLVTVPRVNESDPAVFDTHMFQWGQWERMGFGWGFPFLMARSGP
jgi:phage major head subunit gpT-like protein